MVIKIRLKTIYIKNFGKLKNFRLDLAPGLNVIYGSNEAGKTTVMSFIRMMFYGTSAKSQDPGKNPRKKYAPWDGSPMSGYIEFESGGQDYRIEREFGSSNISDTISVWNLTAGTPEPQSCKYDPGEAFIGMNASAFERSVFIGDISAVVQGTDKEDQITRKLMNYSSSAEESISYELVRKRLTRAHEELRSKGRKNGEIDKLLAELSDKNELLSKAEDEESQRMADEELHASFCEHLERKKERCSRLENSIKEQHIIRELHSLEVQTRKNTVKNELRKKIEELTGKISSEDFTVTEQFLDLCSDMLSKLERLRENYSENKQKFNRLSNEYSEMKLDEILEAYAVDIDGAAELLNELNTKITGLRNEISSTENAKNEIHTLISETKIKEELYREHIEDMEPNYKLLILCSSMIICAIALFIRNPWFLLSVIPVTAVIFGVSRLAGYINRKRDEKAGIEHKAPDYEAAYRSYDEKLEEYEKRTDELSCEISLAESQVSENEEKKKQLELESNKTKILNDTKTSELSELNSGLQKQGSEISELEFHITDYFASYRKVSNTAEIPELIEEALDTLSEIEKTKAVLESKLEEDVITDSPEEISSRTAVLREKLGILTEGAAPRLLPDSQADALEEELETLKAEIASLKDEIADMRTRITAKYQSSDEPALIKNEINEIKRRLAEAAKYDQALLAASEVMEEAGNEIRQTFAPELNSKTQRIFSHLTGGKYSEAIVSKDLEITSSQKDDPAFRQWQYLSTGTYEQAYFSLRLALSDMMTGNRIPVFLDDVFAHYDEERTRLGFLFLNEYSRLNQVIFFTCHRYGIISDQYTEFPERND